MDWRIRARRQQTARRFEFYAAFLFFLLTWVGAIAVAGWIHYVVLGPPTIDRLGAIFLSVGALAGAAFGKWGPTLPFRGHAPEEEAARAFFAGEDVRSDDDRF